MPSINEIATLAMEVAKYRASFGNRPESLLDTSIYETAWDMYYIAEQFHRNEGCTDAGAKEWAEQNKKDTQEKLATLAVDSQIKAAKAKQEHLERSDERARRS